MNTTFIFLSTASIMQLGWMISLKFINFKEIKFLKPEEYFSLSSLILYFPLLGYVVFGLLNVYFLSLAMKNVSMTLAFSIWMGLTIILSTLTEYLFFSEPINLRQLIFIFLILVGIVGLKMNN